MDYSGTQATKLYKYQWDYIHDPQTMLFAWAEEEEEGAMGDEKIIENILTGIRNTVNSNGNELKISNYYTTTYSYGVEVSKWKVVDFGEGNKFTVALYLHEVLDEANKNIVTLLNKTEEIKKRKYLSVNGNCLTLYFKYKERENIYGLEIAVPETEAEKFKEYLFPTFIDKFKTSSEQAIKDAIRTANGKESPARCNVGTRAAFYYMTGDPILFPITCSCLDAFWCEKENLKCGGVEGNGDANSIAKSLEDGLDGFTPIHDVSGHDYPDFAKMQEEVNNGAIIIGAQYANVGSGHVCMLMPEFLDETTCETGLNKKVKINGVLVSVPVALECGSNFKKVRRLVWSPETLKEVKWYKYTKK